METENSQEMDGWRVKHNQLEKDYYKKRHDLYNMVERYYRQNPYGDYVNEDDIYYGPDDVAYCQDCYNEIFGHCEICDSDVEREYMNDVTVHIPEDMIREGIEKINAMSEVDGYFDLSDWQITDYSLRSFSVCDQCCKDYHWRIVHDPQLNGHQFFGDFIDTTNQQMDEIDISMLLRHCDLPGTHYNFRFNHSTREKMQAVWMDLWDKYMK